MEGFQGRVRDLVRMLRGGTHFNFGVTGMCGRDDMREFRVFGHLRLL